MIETAFYAATVVGVIGAVCGVLLAVAKKLLAVSKSPLLEQVENVLPQTNCGACGYAGCATAASEVVEKRAPVDVCVLGGVEVAKNVADILGVPFVQKAPKIATLGCTYGRDASHLRFHYVGPKDCEVAKALHGGGKECSMGCLGFGNCVKVCSFGALTMGDNGLPSVDEKRCTGCGACERSCPQKIITVGNFLSRITDQQQTHNCLAPCELHCPAQIEVPKYIHAILQKDFKKAVQIIKEHNPFLLVCGRVCPHPCEAVCRRGELDEPIAINGLKRFVADFEMEQGIHIVPTPLSSTGKRVAIIGAGPAGLTCAYYLALQGHQVRVYEQKEKPGGVLEYGIPEYRLPKSVLEFEIEGILSLGVELMLNTQIGKDITFEKVVDEFDALFIATGAWSSRKLRIPGEDTLAGVHQGLTFLEHAHQKESDLQGDNVVVIGGGNTAIDCARTAKRLGAKEVSLLYRRTKEVMPAAMDEVEECEQEGIHFNFLKAPLKLEGSEALECVEYNEMEMKQVRGYLKPVPVEGATGTVNASDVICAVGQSPDVSILGMMINCSKQSTVIAKDGTLQTNVSTVFAGGDIHRGAATVVEAIGDGRNAARGIDLLLNEKDVVNKENCMTTPKAPVGLRGGFEHEPQKQKRESAHHLELSERGTFTEVHKRFDEEQALSEASRCLQCGDVCFKGHRGNVT